MLNSIRVKYGRRAHHESMMPEGLGQRGRNAITGSMYQGWTVADNSRKARSASSIFWYRFSFLNMIAGNIARYNPKRSHLETRLPRKALNVL